MKKPIILLAVCFLIIDWGNNVHSQMVSSIAYYSPHNTTLIGTASRFGHHNNNWSTYYMRYDTCSYFCGISYIGVIPTPVSSIKTRMPESFVVTDMKRFYTRQGFIGSYLGYGMHGWAGTYNSTFIGSNGFFALTLPAVDVLNRIATDLRYVDYTDNRIHVPQVKAFATGEKAVGQNNKQSYILTFIAEEDGVFDPYSYASLYYNSESGEKETADDVIIVKEKVIFATRDTRIGHAPINLRIADTNTNLSNGDIYVQWQFLLPSSQKVASELRLLYLESEYFILSYIVFDNKNGKYYLYTNRIILSDLLNHNNTIVTHSVEIGRDCTNLIDVIFEPDVNTMVLLLNGHGKSELYHADPYANTSYTITRLNYPDGEFYSIDTIGDYYTQNIDMYVAMGDSVFFSQDISNGIYIVKSCLDTTMLDMLLQEPPVIDKIEDPLYSLSGEKGAYPLYYKTGEYFEGSKTCFIHSSKDSILNE